MVRNGEGVGKGAGFGLGLVGWWCGGFSGGGKWGYWVGY